MDNEENLLVAHRTIDGELAKWADTVALGFRQKGEQEQKECLALENKVKKMTTELGTLVPRLAKLKRKYDHNVEEAELKEKSARLDSMIDDGVLDLLLPTE